MQQRPSPQLASHLPGKVLLLLPADVALLPQGNGGRVLEAEAQVALFGG
jgi:hypothetical protein